MSTVVDTHTHVIATGLAHYPVDPIGGRQSAWSLEHPVDGDGLLLALDEARIDRAVVVQASTVYGHDNSYLADVVSAHPDRLVGVFSIDATDSGAVAAIEHWQGRGLSGFRLFTTGTTMPGQADWLGHPDSHPAWSYAEAHDIPVCLQMTIEGIPALRGLLELFPKVRVVLDHCARPDLVDGPPYARSAELFELAAYPGVHVKLTHRAFEAAGEGASRVEDFLAALVAGFGANRMMWGSNFPASVGRPSEILADARAATASLNNEDAELVFGGTADTFYPSTSTEKARS